MTRTLFRRGSLLNRVLSLWIALAFVLSLTSVAVAETPASVADETPIVASELASPEEPAPIEAETPAEEPAEVIESVPDEPAVEPAVETESEPKEELETPAASVEADPVTAAAEPMKTAAVEIASSVVPEEVAGNPELGPYGVRIDGGDLPSVGDSDTFELVYGSITAYVTVTVYDNGMGPEFDWTSTYPIAKVVVKGGPIGANVYSYEPPATGDTGLHTPVNPNNDKYSGLSHLDFYLMAPAEVTAYKYHDLDRDGVHDENEPYLQGWNIQLKSGETVVKSGITNQDGKVVFSGVAPGSYTVHETLQDGWKTTSDPYPVPVTLTAGDEEIVKIGNARTSDITVVKYRDTDADGVRDEGEPVLSGWTIQLKKGEEVIASGVTDGSGTVVFEDLDPGSYDVTEVLKSGWFATVGLPVGVVLVEGQDQMVELGNAEYPDLSVLKFHDIDRDGIRDEGEPVLSGWTFQLKVEGAVVYSAITGPDGVATFTDVEPNDYALHEVLQDSWFATTAMPVALSMMPNVDQTIEVGNSLNVTKTFELTYPALPAGASLFVEYSVDGGEPMMVEIDPLGDDVYGFSVDVFYNSTISGSWILMVGQELFTLGEFGPEVLTEDLTNTFEYESIIGGVKYSDDDGDGVRDEGEPGLSGWTINLFRIVGEEPVLYGSTVTGEGGAYAFVGLPPGTYVVEEVMQVGWMQTDAPEGPVTISGENQQALGLDFGNTVFAPFDPEPDTAIEKTADATTADPGDVITYTLTYSNTGDEDIEVVTITDDYDERYMTPVDVGDGVVADGKITWERFNLLIGEERTITYKMKVDTDMPDGTTVIDNVAVIDPFGDSDTWRITVENPSLPFTEDEEDFLPFTGSELLLLGLTLLLVVTTGYAFRRTAKTF